MLKLICISVFLSFSTAVFSEDTRTLNFLVEKTLSDFEKGIELYNKEKTVDLPTIKSKDGFYFFAIKNNEIRFTVSGYLQGQIFINDKLSAIPELEKKTTWFNFIIDTANAEASGELDGASTRILLYTLSTFSSKLEKVGLTCFSDSCKYEAREKNMAKIAAALKDKKDDCEERKSETGYSLEKFKQLNSVHALAMTVLPEYENVKKFMRKTLEVKKKDVNNFMEDYMGSEEKPHASCMEIMLAGSAVDGKGTLSKLKAATGVSPQNEAIINKAKNNCIQLEELKSCMVGLRQDSEAISNAQRLPKDRIDVPEVQSDTYSRTMSR